MALAKWFKIDFHTHTPASSCFPDKSITADMWVEAAKASGINGVVITDHNSIGFLEKIESIKEKYEVKNEFKIFYGIEICVSTEFTHFLIIFNDDLTLKCIEENVVQYLGLRSSNWGDTTICVSEDKLIELYKKCSNDVFIIPAHFASNKGLGITNINAIKKYTDDIEFAAVEIRNNADIHEYNNKFSLNVINKCAYITGSDNPMETDESKHCIEGIGKKYTWIKTATLDFEGLRQVFIDPEFRCMDYVKVSQFGSNYNPNHVMQNYISGLIIKGFKHIDDLDLRFSPYLNCIVGGRGTGKSTLIEAIRAALEGEKIFEDKDILKKTLLKEGAISTFYNFGISNPYRIKVTKASAKTFLYEIDDNNGKVENPPSFRADIYSQKEIYSLIEDDSDVSNSDESPLIKIIDSRNITECFQIKDKIDALSSQLLSKSQDLRNVRTKYSELAEIRAEVKTLESCLKQFEESGLDKKRKDYNLLKDGTTNGQKMLSRVDSMFHRIQEEIDITIENINEIEFESEIIKKYPEIEQCKKAIFEYIDKVNNEVKNNQININEERNKFGISQIYTDLEETYSKYEEAIGELKETGSASIGEIHSKLEKLKEREHILVQYKEEEKIRIAISQLVNQYISERKSLTDIRKNIINSNSIDTLKIEIKTMCHIMRFRQNIQKEFGKEDTYNTIFDTLCNWILESGNNFSNLQKYIEFLLVTETGNINEVYPFEISENRFIRLWKDKFDKNTLSSFINLMPEDMITIKLNDGQNEIDINEGSPGQKCAAVLAFLLSNGNNPLVIDQPEDDLDNSLIYKLIVESIRKMKLGRQIIIVTHNPNIPVLGDAEGVIILERNKSGKVTLYKNKKAGCIEEKVIREGICDIMEGGEVAFKKREKKYMYRI